MYSKLQWIKKIQEKRNFYLISSGTFLFHVCALITVKEILYKKRQQRIKEKCFKIYEQLGVSIDVPLKTSINFYPKSVLDSAVKTKVLVFSLTSAIFVSYANHLIYLHAYTCLCRFAD